MSTNNSSQQFQHISHLITTSFNKSHELFLRNHLTNFKAIDFISHIYHNLITTLSQQMNDILFNKLITTSFHHNNFKNTFQQTLHNFISTNSSQLHFNKLFNNYSDRSSTNSSAIIVTDLQQTLQQL